MDYTLSAIFQAHASDVKDVVFISEDLLASCSRDHSIMVWELASKSIITQIHTHTNYVNALCCVMDASRQTPFIVSAGTDKVILVHHVYTGECTLELKGHTANVCVLAAIPDAANAFISGSWDKTARVWLDGECKFTLKGHDQSVWGVLALSPTRFMTASADKTIKIWDKDQCIQTISAHSDVARALCYLPEQSVVASCGNDGVVKTWSETGQPIHELHGHTSFVYKVASNASTGELVSCGEDRTVRIWKASDLKQTLTLPIITVWSVAVSPNGLDLAAAGNDGNVYLFTRNPEKVANAETKDLYSTSLANFAIPKNQVGDVNKETLPGPEALLVEGKKDGQVIMVKTDTSVEAHQWSASEIKWVKIGDVVDAIGSGRKQIHQGIEYDYVFDIDTGSGQFLKLPYNLKENPYEAAHRFLVKHDLDPLAFGEQVVNFIIENTKGATISQGAGQEDTFIDPYTGQNRYRSSAGPAPAASSRAVDTASLPKYNPWVNNAAPSAPTTALLPVTSFITFQQFNFQAIGKKIEEWATQFQVTLDVTNLEKTCWETAQQILRHAPWPLESKFPALDLLRYYVLKNAEHSSELVPLILATVQAKKAELNALMGFRVIANMFQITSHRAAVLSALHSILVQLNDYRVSTNKNVRLSIVTVLLNLSIHIHQVATVLPDTVDILAILVEFLQHETDSETLYRTVAAIGTLCSLRGQMKQYIGPFNLKVFLSQVMDKEKEIRTLQAIQECLNIISS